MARVAFQIEVRRGSPTLFLSALLLALLCLCALAKQLGARDERFTAVHLGGAPEPGPGCGAGADPWQRWSWPQAEPMYHLTPPPRPAASSEGAVRDAGGLGATAPRAPPPPDLSLVPPPQPERTSPSGGPQTGCGSCRPWATPHCTYSADAQFACPAYA